MLDAQVLIPSKSVPSTGLGRGNGLKNVMGVDGKNGEDDSFSNIMQSRLMKQSPKIDDLSEKSISGNSSSLIPHLGGEKAEEQLDLKKELFHKKNNLNNPIEFEGVKSISQNQKKIEENTVGKLKNVEKDQEESDKKNDLIKILNNNKIGQLENQLENQVKNEMGQTKDLPKVEEKQELSKKLKTHLEHLAKHSQNKKILSEVKNHQPNLKFDRDPHKFVEKGLKSLESNGKKEFFVDNSKNQVNETLKSNREELKNLLRPKKLEELIQKNGVGEYSKSQSLNRKGLFDTQIEKIAKTKESFDHVNTVSQFRDSGLGDISQFENKSPQVRVLNLNSIVGSGGNQQVINQIENYIQQAAVANEKSVGLIFQHDQLGNIGLNVDKLHNDEISIKIMTNNDASGKFFETHKDHLISSLQDSGHKVFDFKIDHTSGMINGANKSFLSESGQSSNQNQHNLNSDDQGRDNYSKQDHFDRNSGQNDKERRRDLWERAFNKDLS